jgi:arsenite methyltransferase
MVLARKLRYAMEPFLTENEKKRIQETIRQRYHKVAESPEGQFRYPTGIAGLVALGYEQALMEKLPEHILGYYCGVGNPFSLGRPREGEVVLDIGCGAGVDVFMAALMVGPSGKAVGIDMVPDMVEKARQNLKETKLRNVALDLGSAESLPFPDGGFDMVISNGVFNLILDKRSTLREVLRVLKPAGRLQIADQVLVNQSPKDKKALIESWSQ